MILKIRKPGGWVMFDNVIQTDFTYPNKSQFRFNKTKDEVEIETENGWRDVIHADVYVDRWRLDTLSKGKVDPELIPLAEARITRQNVNGLGTSTELILFTEGYLMNENGKTLESIS